MPRGKRPATSYAGQELLDALSDLLKRMEHTGTSPTSMSVIDAYDTYVKSSEFGRECQFAKKCELLFVNGDYEDIKTILLHVLQCIRKIEGSDWGKQ